ncbi:MAG TPA: ABC transporter ATP-binding protein [Candidatus Caenarcaniphilales bacterium]|nr:ABC transporter ATP-binding protein [Candidatus Caenarcaniphilales bacterium]
MRQAAPAVRMVNVAKSFGSVVALDRFELEVSPGQMLCLLGPSGCGKTTALRLIAGFEQPDHGAIEINGRRVAAPGASVPPERRRVGMVFQDFALFPHLSVGQNVGYGIRRDPDRDVRVSELLEMVGLSGDAERMPHQLSGGMQQRVALARALAPRPAVVLLDEPFSNLDQALRTQLRGEVREILRQARATAIFVTHDQEEALTIADHVCVMARGYVEQCAAPEIVYAEPASPFVATFIGVANLVHGEVSGASASTRFGAVRLIGPPWTAIQGRALVLLRPEHFELSEAADGPADGRGWRVMDRRFSGAELLLALEAHDGTRLWCDAGQQVRRLAVGDIVEVRLRNVETVAFPPGRLPRGTAAGRDRARQRTSEMDALPDGSSCRRAVAPPARRPRLDPVISRLERS